jgi:hypothetical protein
MFGRKQKVEVVKLHEVMDNILSEMAQYGPDSPEYPKLLGHLERVIVMLDSKERRMPSPDGMLLVLGNLFGILIIVAYEQKHVMTSKALSFVSKSK